MVNRFPQSSWHTKDFIPRNKHAKHATRKAPLLNFKQQREQRSV